MNSYGLCIRPDGYDSILTYYLPNVCKDVDVLSMWHEYYEQGLSYANIAKLHNIDDNIVAALIKRTDNLIARSLYETDSERYKDYVLCVIEDVGAALKLHDAGITRTWDLQGLTDVHLTYLGFAETEIDNLMEQLEQLNILNNPSVENSIERDKVEKLLKDLGVSNPSVNRTISDYYALAYSENNSYGLIWRDYYEVGISKRAIAKRNKITINQVDFILKQVNSLIACRM